MEGAESGPALPALPCCGHMGAAPVPPLLGFGPRPPGKAFAFSHRALPRPVLSAAFSFLAGLQGEKDGMATWGGM